MMVEDNDEDRIRRKAHELWEADGRHHGRDQDYWIQAREIIAIQDSQGSTLLARDTGAVEPIEDADEALRNLGDFPNLTDQGENLLTSTDREPTFGGMPSVEVPTSGQPGIPEAPVPNAVKPDPDMQASPKNNAPPPSKKDAPAAKPAAAAKPSTPAGKPSSPARPAGPKKP